MARMILVAAIILTILATPPARASAQEGLDSVESLASDGRTEEARDALETWWNDERTQSSRRDRQRGLWLRGVLTVDPEMATLDYQRLVVGYPGGPYSDEALVRLAMIAGSRSDLLAAAGYYRSLLQDYPRSPERIRARQWIDENSAAIEEAEADAAVAAQAAALEKAAADSTLEPGAPAETGSLEPVVQTEAVVVLTEESGQHAVQLGAFLTQKRAERLAGRVSAAGFDARIVLVEGSELVRVRVGRFTGRAEAAGVMSEIEQLGYDAAVVSDVAEEEPIR